ncbi:RNA polymerase, omega subunit [Cylindrospermopsis raciborskii CS-505]|nr:RNA polymerase, omega subunit [Cylindrospermopsis raciborskii CS-505]
MNRTSKIQPKTTMLKRSRFETTQSQVMQRSEDLINAASNRYRITVQVANRAKRRRYEDFENNEDSIMKPVLRAIIEMSDELTQPEIIGELPSDWL